MKRVLIVSLVVLELALVALVWWASTRKTTREAAPVAELELSAQDTASDAATELDAASHWSTTVQSAHARRSAADAGPAQQDPPPMRAQGLAADSVLHGMVVFGDTGLPVTVGSVDCSYWIPRNASINGNPPAPDRPTVFIGPDEVVSDVSVGSRSQSGTIHSDGTFALPIHRSARDILVEVAGHSRTQPKDPGTYLPCQVKLDKPSAELGPVLRIEVERGFELSGLVLDADTGMPIPSARVQTGDNWRMHASAVTDPRGWFVLGGMGLRDEHAKATLTCSHADFLRTEFAFEPGRLHPNEAALVLRPRRGHSIEGTLLDRDGKPLWAIGVLLETDGLSLMDNERPEPQPLSARTGLHGTFRFSTVPPCANATIRIEAQSSDGRAVLDQRFPLGAILGNRREVELRAITGVSVAVSAELASGTRLGPEQFTLVCTPGGRARVISRNATTQVLSVPLNERIEIEAFARAASGERRDAFVHGVGRVSFDRETTTPAKLTIVLSETSRFEVPMAEPGTVRLRLPAPDYLRGALDVQLVDDATGAALVGEHEMRLTCGEVNESLSHLPNGWLRLIGQPGRYELHIQGERGVDDMLQLTIPSSGYAKCTARVRTRR